VGLQANCFWPKLGRCDKRSLNLYFDTSTSRTSPPIFPSAHVYETRFHSLNPFLNDLTDDDLEPILFIKFLTPPCKAQPASCPHKTPAFPRTPIFVCIDPHQRLTTLYAYFTSIYSYDGRFPCEECCEYYREEGSRRKARE
jgi:hypothetical protein